jgi:hypothetical protein
VIVSAECHLFLLIYLINDGSEGWLLLFGILYSITSTLEIMEYQPTVPVNVLLIEI